MIIILSSLLPISQHSSWVQSKRCVSQTLSLHGNSLTMNKKMGSLLVATVKLLAEEPTQSYNHPHPSKFSVKVSLTSN